MKPTTNNHGSMRYGKMFSYICMPAQGLKGTKLG